MQRTTRVLIGMAAALLMWSPAVRAERDLEFAKGLMNKGFYDLAIEQYQLLEGNKNASDDNRAQASLQLADCFQKAGEASTKPEVKDDFLSKATEQLGKFLKEYKGRPEANEARFRIAVLNQTRGFEKDRLLQATQDPKLQAKLKEEGAKLFTEAANTFGDIVDQLEPKIPKEKRYQPDEKPDSKQQEIMERYLLARGQMGWTYYYLSQLYSHDPKDKDLMKKQLLEAQNVFQPFLKDYPNYLISLWVMCGQGLTYRGLGDTEKAIEQFRRVIAKRRTEDANPIRHKAYFWLVETYRMTQQYDDAIRTANRFIQEVPETFNSDDAQAIKLEKAKAYAEQVLVYEKEKKKKEAAANRAQAIKIAGDLVKLGGTSSVEAGKWLRKWQEEWKIKPTEVRVPATETYAEGNKLMADAKEAADKKDTATAAKNYAKALKAYKLVVEDADPDEEAAMIADTWFNMGTCYYFRGLPYEAALAFEEMARRYPDNQLAAKAARAATGFFAMVYQQQPCDYTADLYIDSCVFFVEKFPKHPDAPKLAVQVGETLRGQKRFLKAADVYSNIPPFSEYYERACYMAGNCYWLAFLDLVSQDPTKADSAEGRGMVERATGRLTEFINWALKQPKISDEKEKDKLHWVALSRVRLAGIYVDELVKPRQPGPALEVLSNFEGLYPAEQKSFPEVACLRVQAQAWTGQLPDAIKEMEKIIQLYGQHEPKAVSKTARTIGAACAGVFEHPAANLKGSDIELYRQYAAKYLKLAIDVCPDLPFADYSVIGDKLMALKAYADAVQVFAKGRAKYQQTLPLAVQWVILAKEAECYFNSNQWKSALDSYKQLDNYVKTAKDKALVYKRNMGLCYENLGMWAEALNEAWNILNEKLPQGTPMWFEAKIHQIHCLAKVGDDANAWKNFAQQILFTWPEVGGPEIKKQFMELLDKDLSAHKAEFDELIKKLEAKK